MNASCERLVVLKFLDAEYAEIVFDGPGEAVWNLAGKIQKNGQRPVSLAVLKTLDGWLQ